MERAVNKNPSKDSSDVSDSSSTVDFPPQAMITWLLVSVAVGLVTIYTMIQFISNKLTKEIKGKKTEGKKNTTDLYSQSGAKQDTTNYDLKTPQDNSKKSEECGKMKENGPSLTILQAGSENAEKPDFVVFDSLENGNVERLETNKSLICEDAMKSTKCQNNVASVHMGKGFSGNLSIETEAEEIKEPTCDECSNTAAEHVTTCRSTATLEDYCLNHNTPVTVNNVQLKCFSCNAKIPGNNEVTVHDDQHSTDATNRHSTTCIPEVTKDLNGVNLEDEFGIKNKIDCEGNHPLSTINCIQTAIKCLNCAEASPLPMQKDCKKSNENLQSSFLSNGHGLEETSNPLQTTKIEKVKATEVSLQNLDSKDSDISQLDHCVENDAATKTTSESLNFLSNYHTPRDTTDGSVVSKNTTKDDQFIFPRDYEKTAEKEPVNISNSVEELETPRSRYLKSLRNDPLFSKSLDSQMEVLKKGCKLLEKKPLKSSLRSAASSEGNLEKFVHFPEDIRHIRTVHKYVSLDELWLCVDAEGSAEKQPGKQRTQSLDN